MMRVFLGGTCNNSTWRDRLIKELNGVDYFNPVVDEWTSEAQKEEILQRKICDYCLYVITPKMTGVYSIAEVVEDSIKRPDKTVFCFLKADGDKKFTSDQIKSLGQVGKMVEKNGGRWIREFHDLPGFFNYEIGLATEESDIAKKIRMREMMAARRYSRELKRLKPAVKNKINKIYGEMCRKYYNKIPLKEIFDVLGKFDIVPLQEDGTKWDGFLSGSSGTAHFDIASVDSLEKGFYTPYENVMLRLDWYKLESGRYEINVYIS